MSVKERLKIFVKSKDISISAFENSISASNGYVNSMRKAISNDKLQVILEQYPDLNPEWLLTGSGNMLRNETSILVEHEDTVQNLDNNVPVYNINFSAGNINVFNDVKADLI